MKKKKGDGSGKQQKWKRDQMASSDKSQNPEKRQNALDENEDTGSAGLQDTSLNSSLTVASGNNIYDNSPPSRFINNS